MAIVRWLASKLANKAISGLLLLAATAVYLIFLINGTNVFYEQGQFQLLETENEASVKTITRAKQITEANLIECRNEKEHFQQTNTTLRKKLEECERQHDAAGLSVEETNMLKHVREYMHSQRAFFEYVTAVLRDTPYPGIENYTRYSVARLGLMPIDGVQPLVPEFGVVVNDVTSFRYPISIPPCQEGNRSVFIAIISAPGNFNKREMIRQTWLNHLEDVHEERLLRVAGYGFVIGLTENNETQKAIEEESHLNGDIIQIEMSDFYRNLSLKVAGLLNWLNGNCFKVDFVLKVDDDVYVNVRNLVHFLEAHHPSNHSIFGLGAGNLFPARWGQWNITVEEWPWSQYPPYFFGPAVLIPGNTVLPLLAACQTTPMMPFDDVYLTGMCTEKAGITVLKSFNSTSVLAMGLPGIPTACHVHHYIAWTTVSGNHMNNSHASTNDFYRNETQCILPDESSGTNRTVDPTEFVHFSFY
ncbi:hypothetical protein GHT06_011097 [Daphnia sinensis]|uniref:Hexosyltransferase n=1 Tax=Daphnia sinensis TaxID=1820382 RepID=A0AAD5LJU6_9CRUS|nr:hypothetical protein GHT06_011097 [Daphnia sinensis]